MTLASRLLHLAAAILVAQLPVSSVAAAQVTIVKAGRLLDVQTTSTGVWLHGAVPIVRADGSSGREHVLFTTQPWQAPLYCDRDQAVEAALTPATSSRRVKLDVLQRHAATKAVSGETSQGKQ